MKKAIRFLALLLAAAMLPLPAAWAASPSTSNMSDSYKSSVYYERLMEVELTGNQITDLIAVAASQLGYTEGTDKSDLTGNGSGSGNCTEYGRFTKTNGNAWCASFVSWCFRKAGIPTSVMPTSAGVGGLRRSVYNNGAVWHSVDSGYTPRAGDLVLYESMTDGYKYYRYVDRDANGVPTSSSHVGIVVSDFDLATQTYCTIEGNGNGGCVKYLTGQKLYSAGKTKDGSLLNRIQGFVTPAYTTGTGSGYDGSGMDDSVVVSLTVPTDPDYLKKQALSDTNATVVCRVSKPSGSSITQSGLILSAADGTLIKKHTESVTNVKDSTTVFHSWYDINKELGVTLEPGTTYRYQFFAVVNGKEYFGNTYTLQTTGDAPRYTLTFDPAGGSLAETSRTVTARSVAGDLPIPTLEGYEFTGWYTQSGTLFSASTTVTGDQALTAGWELAQNVELDDQPEVPSPDTSSFGISLINSLNSRGEVELAPDEPRELDFRVTKAAGVPLDYIVFSYADASGSLIGTVSDYYTYNTYSQDMIEEEEVTIWVDPASAFPSDVLRPGDRREFDCAVVLGGEMYSTPTHTLVISGGQSYDVSFYDLTTMLSYGTIPQVNGSNYVLPPAPSKQGYRFDGWALDKTPIDSHTTVELTGSRIAHAVWTKLPTGTTSAPAFSDVPAGAYYSDAVTWAVERGITNGTGPNTFSPDQTCTRGQIITFLWRAAGSPEPWEVSAFSDVKADAYYAKAAAWAKEKGMASGGVFSPDSPCTREMAVEFMWKYAGSPAAPAAGFTDVSSPAVNWAVAKGVTNGTGPTTFSPATTCTRGQIVTFLYRGFAG